MSDIARTHQIGSFTEMPGAELDTGPDKTAARINGLVLHIDGGWSTTRMIHSNWSGA